MTALGIDYGTCMLKAATAASADAPPEKMVLAAKYRQSCLPAIGRDDGQPVDPWNLLLTHLLQTGVAAGLRDRLAAPGDVVVGAGGRQAARAWNASLVATLREALERSLPGATALPFVLAVPDHWGAETAADAWTLPPVLAAAGWLPRAFVRESAAVLATRAPSPRRPVVIMSLGAGAARVSVWTFRDTAWTRDAVRSCVLTDVSGEVLRQRVGQIVRDEVVRMLRRDPAESVREDQEVRNGIELLLDKLRRNEDGVFHGTMFDRVVVLPIDRTAVLDCCRSFRERIARALTTLGPALGKFDVLCWGELTTLLPLHDWLVEIDGVTEVAMASFHAVAEGAARIAALLAEGILAFPTETTVDAATGLRVATGQGIPLVEAIPLELLPAGPRTEAWLVELESGRRHSIGQAVRVGRDPRLEVSFDSRLFPELGRHHFTIFRVGDEFELHDNASRNGTYVNGEAQRLPRRLAAGDRIQPGPNGPPLVFEVDRS